MKEEMKYLEALSKQYPSIASASTEIINLNAILSLPKGTEHFITDVHGEYDQFLHVLKNGSGAIRRKIDDAFGPAMRTDEKKSLAALIYYPKLKLEEVKKTETDMKEWYRSTIYQLICICKKASSKYTRSKVRKAIPKDFAYIIEELMTGHPDEVDQEAYYNEIIHSVIETKQAEELIVAFADLIRRLVIDHLHVIGDIFDRGPKPHLIMDELMRYHSVDIQWGNHDIEWMGAACGSEALIATVIRNQARYGNLDILEDGYGINLIPLVRFAMETYKDDNCDCFGVHYRDDDVTPNDRELDEKIHKAISIIQFKLEGQVILRNKNCGMEDRLLLSKIDTKDWSVTVDGKKYPMLDHSFPTVDWENPFTLSSAEEEVVTKLKAAFLNSEKLQRHVSFLYTKGSLYKVFNGNLLYHGCMPLCDDGAFKKVSIFGKEVWGRNLYDYIEEYARKGFYALDESEKRKGLDTLYFMWAHPDSPVFGKRKMATFERYFIKEKETHVEVKNPYYQLIDQESIVNSILEEFGLDIKNGHIVNGHVPVEAKKGESPIRCNGKLLIIDGGFSKAYQPTTGIAGYTLMFNSYGMILAAHEPFESVEKAVREGSDIHSQTLLVERTTKRITVADTDTGHKMKDMVLDLSKLLEAYRDGKIVSE
ncbi:MAG: fructose-1,6-bisphosphatase [Lachnospiraceae bacterium]|nr:fructose-1,6-bisphosphatase [Lachnospiraceae bacterium]